MANPGDEHLLWKHDGVECVMISCCAGAELQLRRTRVEPAEPASRHQATDFDIILRELYPTKSDLYERARALALDY